MADRIINVINGDGSARLILADTRDCAEQARQYHNTTPTATALLGRVLTAAAMLGSDLKEESYSVTLRVEGDGPAGRVVAVADGDSFCRGYLENPNVDLPLNEKGKLDVGGAVGKGSLTVIKDLHMKEPYVGRVRLVSGEIAEDITRYLYVSEQAPGACALGVLVRGDGTVSAAGGFMLMLLPGAGEETVAGLESALAELPPVTKMLSGGMGLEDIAGKIFNMPPSKVIREIKTGYRCRCSRERVVDMLISLGREELEALEKESQSVETTCQFCGKVYNIPVGEVVAKVKK